MAEFTTNSAKAWSPDVHSFAPSEVIPDALVLQTSLVSGNVEGDEPVLRVAYVDDDDAGFVPEGAQIPEADPDLAEVTVATGKIAQLIRVSREQWLQQGTSGLLSESVRRAVTKAANLAYIAQAAPVAPAITPPAGLLNIAGIVDGGTVATDLDVLADALTTIEENGGNASHIIASPSAWNSLRKLKTGTGSNVALLGAGTTDADRRLLGVPVLTTSAMPTGGLIILDRTAVVSAVGSIQVATSEQRYFETDSIGLRATWRFGANLVRPERVVKLTVTEPA
ncbi:phage major capsid protein [Microbacterium paludicola]|uniref:phage major capsid protein n=1 Tax=Microbacterium paludicola TaxID=300019 RepID=UPI00387A7210